MNYCIEYLFYCRKNELFGENECLENVDKEIHALCKSIWISGSSFKLVSMN